MNYTTHLLPGYDSWLAFYEAVKPHVGLYNEDIYWNEFSEPPILLRSVQARPDKVVASTKKHKYSVRYIQEQVIAELTKQVKMQSFDRHDLKGLQIALEHWGHMGDGTHVRRLMDKVGGLLEIEQTGKGMKTDYCIRYQSPDLNLVPEPIDRQPVRRHTFSYSTRVLREKVILDIMATRQSLDQLIFTGQQEWAIDEAYRLVDLSNAYQLEIWIDRRTQRLFLQFLLAD